MRFSRCPGWRDRAFGVAIDDGLGEFYARLGFEATGATGTKVSAVVDVPHMDESAHVSGLNEVAERWPGSAYVSIWAGVEIVRGVGCSRLVAGAEEVGSRAIRRWSRA